jgi:hypothetical protein
MQEGERRHYFIPLWALGCMGEGAMMLDLKANEVVIVASIDRLLDTYTGDYQSCDLLLYTNTRARYIGHGCAYIPLHILAVAIFDHRNGVNFDPRA